MKKFTNKNKLKIVCAILIFLILFVSIVPNYSLADNKDNPDETVGGKLFNPIFKLFAGVGDLVIKELQKMFLGIGDIRVENPRKIVK